MNQLLKTDFISVVIPAFNRWPYLRELIESIHTFSDMPFEIIVHDDSSETETKAYLASRECRDMVSTIISNDNPSWNLGLAQSADRGISLASSDYIFFINADCKLVKSCFKDIRNVLSNEYVGYIAPMENNDLPKNGFFKTNDTSFFLAPGIGGGACLAFRKSVWKQTNGFFGTEGIWTGAADIHIMNAIWKLGYFRAGIIGTNPIYNTSLYDRGNQDTTINGKVNDCSYPKIFKLPFYENKSRTRYNDIDHYKHSIEHNPAERNNTPYWHDFSMDMLEHFPDIDWDLAKKHNHDRWKSHIQNDLIKTN